MDAHLRPKHYASATPVNPPIDDYILVSRNALNRLESHLLIEHERLPGRRLRQALQIIQHILAGHQRNNIV